VRAVDAAIAFRAGNYRRALAIWKDLETTEADDVKRVGLLQNIALCSRELADYESAFSCYDRALEIARRSGAQVAVLVRLRWSVAKMLTLQHRYVESLSILRSVAAEFSELGMREEAVLASLDISELLMIRNDHEGAVAICRDIIRELSAANLEHTSRALTAVAYLKQSILSQSASSALVGHVRDYIGRVRTQPALLFAPPPDWRQ
jgi:tetratricopeptide (TPR) repeat protein